MAVAGGNTRAGYGEEGLWLCGKNPDKSDECFQFIVDELDKLREVSTKQPERYMQRSLPPLSVNISDQMQQQHNQIAIPIGPPPPLPLNLPCGQLIEGTREDYIKFCVPLFEALMKGDWIAAKAIFDIKPGLVRFAVTKNFDTPLHIAAAAESTRSSKEFVENLVKLMEKKDMELQNKSYNTAFSLAAMVGNVETTKIILEKNKAVLEIPGSQGMMPLYVAAVSGNYDMVTCLYDISKKMSGDFWTNEMRGWVLKKCVEGDLYEVAGKIVNDCTQLTSNKKLLSDVLLVLAQKTDAFREKEPNHILRIIESIVRSFLIFSRFYRFQHLSSQVLCVIHSLAIMSRAAAWSSLLGGAKTMGLTDMCQEPPPGLPCKYHKDN
ncbi:unnamed protein product [Lactuca saligna]|uniref:Ankyrin repeat-containing protein n=1 Tax=Lactuca saligna TaxID=75948 RepID=A0AA35VAL2_LACSI|nr:unnamed protein product [Lactuca saligna]